MSGYATVEQADIYVAEHYISTDPLRIAWNALSQEDKQVILNVSAEAIDSLPYPGRKLDPTQSNAFPRYPSQQVPAAIIAAQIENAISVSDSSSSEDAALYQRMWSFGIASYRIGNLSESVGNASGGASLSAQMLQNGIVSTKAQALLKPFIGGAYCIE